MKRGVVSVVTVVLSVFAVSSAVAFNTDELNRITFANNTGFEIQYLFFSPGDSEYWGADVLGSSRTFADGDQLAFYIHYPDPKDKFDFLAIDTDGDSYVIRNVTVSDKSESQIAFTLDDLADSNYNFNFAQVKLDNQTGEDIYYCFLSPADSKMYGVDMLDDQTVLSSGGTLSLLVPVGSNKSNYDVIGVGKSGGEYSFSIGIDNSKDTFRYALELSDAVQ